MAAARQVNRSRPPWLNLLRELKHRGLTVDPKLAIGDGALGFWKALGQVYATARPQRCWVHRTANVQNKPPKRLHGEAKDRIHQTWMAATRDDAEGALDHFIETYHAKYAQAVECLKKTARRF